MNEKRLTSRLTSYWEMLRKEQPLPEFSKFNSSSIADAWDTCMTLAIQPSQDNNARTYKYVQLGPKLVTMLGKDPTGSYVKAKQRGFPGARIIKDIDKAADSAEPLYDGGQFVTEKNKVVKFRSCLLPFGNANDGVTHMLVGLSWREF